jgi:hypothetical protein
MSKTRANFRIKQNIKYTDSSPEMALDSICEALGLGLAKGKEIQAPGFTLRPDRQIVDTNILLEADGRYHDSRIQNRKNDWRDDLLVKSGYRVLHIESELLVTHGLGNSRQFWPHVSTAISEFLLSDEAVKYLHA